MKITDEAIRLIKTKFTFKSVAVREAYDHGYDCGLNGANLTNCHFSIFQSQDNTAAWNEGKKDGEEDRGNKFSNTQ